MIYIILIVASLGLLAVTSGQQVADTAYMPFIHDPAYEFGEGLSWRICKHSIDRRKNSCDFQCIK
jgi:hypothetical protein